MSETATIPHSSGKCLATIDFVGADAAVFLQGQLTIDTQKLAEGHWRRAAYCSRQGRMLANGLLCRLTEEKFRFVVSADLAEQTAAFIKRFVMRAKVRVEVINVSTKALMKSEAPSPPARQGEVREEGDECTIVVSPDCSVVLSANGGEEEVSAWRQNEIESGVVWLQAASIDRLIPQFANLEALAAVDFDKGCFVGQEVIARLHHLGEVKRRTFVVRGDGGCPPPAAPITDEASKTVGEVVNSIAGKSGYCALACLAVAATAESIKIQEEAVRLSPPPYDFPQKEKFNRSL